MTNVTVAPTVAQAPHTEKIAPAAVPRPAPVQVRAPNVNYNETEIHSTYDYNETIVTRDASGNVIVEPKNVSVSFRTQRKVPRTGIMIIGWGGNNGSTVTAAVHANRNQVSWRTKSGIQHANYLGSITQSSTVRLGMNPDGSDAYVPLNSIVPMLHPNDIVFGGWDISNATLAEAMERAMVLDFELQRQLQSEMSKLVPLPAIFDLDFVAANQEGRATNILRGSKAEQVEQVRQHIRDFKAANNLEKVMVIWSANTERFSDVIPGVHDTKENLLAAIQRGEKELAPSALYAVAAIQEGCTYINGAPQNTLVPGVVELAAHHGVFVGGDDFKSGQTKLKSVLVEFLVGAGIKPECIASYNHLGNNDGKNLDAPKQFRSKEISKSNVVDDMVQSNSILYPNPTDKPDHCIVIKYLPYVGDSKRALDEYTCSIFMGGTQTFVIHNTCEDSLLASPLILDLCILAELMERVEIGVNGEASQKMHTVLSILSYLLKAPAVPQGTPVVNALFRQKCCIENTLRALVGLPAENNMLLQHKLGQPLF